MNTPRYNVIAETRHIDITDHEAPLTVYPFDADISTALERGAITYRRAIAIQDGRRAIVASELHCGHFYATAECTTDCKHIAGHCGGCR